MEYLSVLRHCFKRRFKAAEIFMNRSLQYERSVISESNGAFCLQRNMSV